MYDKCMTKQKENRVAGIYNAVSVRSEADSNRCIRFCRPLPSHSAIRPIPVSRLPVSHKLTQPSSRFRPLPAKVRLGPSGSSGVQIYKHFPKNQNFRPTFSFLSPFFVSRPLHRTKLRKFHYLYRIETTFRP